MDETFQNVIDIEKLFKTNPSLAKRITKFCNDNGINILDDNILKVEDLNGMDIKLTEEEQNILGKCTH